MATDNGVGLDYIALATEIVSAFVSNNSVPVPELPALIAAVHSTLNQLSGSGAEAKVESPTPAVSLKRHLRTRYDMTPDQYRAKWNLAADYPMVAPNYAAARSELAKTMGLGQQRRKSRTKAAELAPEPVAAPAPPARRTRARASAEA